jgi:hypothetical protein
MMPGAVIRRWLVPIFGIRDQRTLPAAARDDGERVPTHQVLGRNGRYARRFRGCAAAGSGESSCQSGDEVVRESARFKE